MGVLLSTTNPMQKKIKWALVVHTLALFLFLTVPLGVELTNSSTAYIDDREFPGDGEIPPGPFGYDYILYNEPTFTVFNFMFPLNQWLADGLLVGSISNPVVLVSNVLRPLLQLHRCFVIYSKNHSAMAFPYLLYLASVGTCTSPLKAGGDVLITTTDVAVGIAHIYEFSAINVLTDTSMNLNTSYYSICLSLNVLLTLMIVIRLVVHIRNVRKVTGASDGSTGLHTATATVVAILIESYAIYAIALLLYIIPWVISSPVVALFSKALGTMQVRFVFIYLFLMCCRIRTLLFNLVAYRLLRRI